MLQIETCILILLRMVPVEKQTEMTKDCTFRLNKKAQERGISFQSSTAARVTKVDHETVEAKKLKCPFSGNQEVCKETDGNFRCKDRCQPH